MWSSSSSATSSHRSAAAFAPAHAHPTPQQSDVVRSALCTQPAQLQPVTPSHVQSPIAPAGYTQQPSAGGCAALHRDFTETGRNRAGTTPSPPCSMDDCRADTRCGSGAPTGPSATSSTLPLSSQPTAACAAVSLQELELGRAAVHPGVLGEMQQACTRHQW